jgi:hypothetical protein
MSIAIDADETAGAAVNSCAGIPLISPLRESVAMAARRRLNLGTPGS